MKKTTKNANATPININFEIDIPKTQIAARAYERFLERGGEHGHDLEDWLSAERELLAERRGGADSRSARLAG